MKQLIREFEEKINSELEEAGFKKFQTPVPLKEIIKNVLEEGESGKLSGRGLFHLPDIYHLSLNPSDYEVMESTLERLADTSAVFIKRYARENDYMITADVEISFGTDPETKTGNVIVKADFRKATRPDEGEERGPESTRAIRVEEAVEKGLSHPEAAVLVLEENRTISLVKPSTLIGRLDANDIVLNDSSISRVHAEIKKQNGRFIVRDLESTNGTFLNGKQVKEKALKDGDIISVGIRKLEFKYYKNQK